MVTKKPEQKEEKPKAPSKERVKQLIEEKMEKIKQQELVKDAEPKAKAQSGGKVSKDTFKPEAEKPAAKKEAKVKPLPTTAFVTGKRKRSVARAYFKPGKGVIKVNSVPIELVRPEMFRLRMMEPLMLTGESWKKYDANITVSGGGSTGQADAVRQAIARGLSEVLGPEARRTFLSYDRNLIVYDPRRTEPHKPPHSSWGPRRYKQRSKR
jgi:ribosomal protein S9